MRLAKTTTALAAALIAAAATLPQAQAITIAHGGDSVDIDFVDINYNGTAAEDAGDPANTVNGANPGVVTYDYSIGTYEITSDQWATVTGFDALIENNSNDPYSGSQPTAGASGLFVPLRLGVRSSA